MDKKKKNKILIGVNVFVGLAFVFVVGSVVLLKDKEVIGVAGQEALIAEEEEKKLQKEAEEHSVKTKKEILNSIDEKVGGIINQISQEGDFIESEGSIFTN